MFGYIPLWLDMYLDHKGGVGTDPRVIGELGTLLARVHSTFSTTQRASSSRPNSNPPTQAAGPSPEMRSHALATSAVESGYYCTSHVLS